MNSSRNQCQGQQLWQRITAIGKMDFCNLKTLTKNAITRFLGQFLPNTILRMCKIGNFSTSGQIFLMKFETVVARFLLDNEIWWHLQQDLSVFGAKKWLSQCKIAKI